jgi:basic membrane protein A
MRFVSAFVAGGLVLAAAGCGEAPENEGEGTAAEKFSACMVTDVGGIDDKSFNASAWQGLEAAKAENGNIDIKYVASKAEMDYEPNLTQYVNQGCDFILAVGGLMGEATSKIAAAHPDQQFGIVDASLPDNPNVYPMQFDTAQAAFLAGYLSAGMSKTGKVGTYGAMKIPPVTIFMDGFVDGVAHYNKAKSANVQALGWDKATQNGSFTNDFMKQDEGKKVGDALVAQGADIVMPVAGGAGLGTTAAAKAAGGKYSVVWVDIDGCQSTPDCSVLLTTVVKNISGAVKEAVLKAAKGEKLDPKPGYLGTLGNEGVSIAPYHEFDSKVPAELKAEIEKLKADIIAGTITVTSPAQPVK